MHHVLRVLRPENGRRQIFIRYFGCTETDILNGFKICGRTRVRVLRSKPLGLNIQHQTDTENYHTPTYNGVTQEIDRLTDNNRNTEYCKRQKTPRILNICKQREHIP